MGKTRIIAETGAGQHGVATAAVCARLGIPCRVYMGEVDMRRQRPNVFWMERYGAEVVPVTTGSATLKDAVNEALRDWAASFPTTHYLLGSALGPSPYPDMVREFQSVIGRELGLQIREKGVDCAALVACVGGGSNAIGFFSPFLESDVTRADRRGGRRPGQRHGAARGADERPGPARESCRDTSPSSSPTATVSSSPPIRSRPASTTRASGPSSPTSGKRAGSGSRPPRTAEALDAVQFFARTEGLVFALESAHAAAAVMRIARDYPREKALVVNMSGRGDKDLFILARAMDHDHWSAFLREESAR